MTYGDHKLDQEEICKSLFSRYLNERKPGLVLSWQRYPNGKSKPPDYNLSFESVLYAVEITQFKQIKSYDGTKVSVNQALAYRQEFVKELEKEAIARDILKGTYSIGFNLNWLIEPTKELRNSIKKQVFGYMGDSTEAEQMKPRILLYKFRPFCEIIKAHNESKRIHVWFADAAWPDSPENVAHVAEGLNAAITTKIRLLETPGVPQPWIMLFGNSYPFASRELYQDRVRSLLTEDLRRFHSLFIVLSPKEGFMFYSQAESWTNTRAMKADGKIER